MAADQTTFAPRLQEELASITAEFNRPADLPYWSYHVFRTGFFSVQGFAGVLAAQLTNGVCVWCVCVCACECVHWSDRECRRCIACYCSFDSCCGEKRARVHPVSDVAVATVVGFRSQARRCSSRHPR